MPGVVGQVLAQGPAAGHVEQLHAAAHAEHRQPGRHRGVQQFQFGRVARHAHPAGARMRLRAVPGWVDVAAAGEQQPVEPAHGRGDAGQWRQQDRGSPPAAATCSA